MSTETSSEVFVHSISEAGRLLPSASKWNSIEVDYGSVLPSSKFYDSSFSKYSQSYNFHLTIKDTSHFKKFIYVSIALVLLMIGAVLLTVLLPHKDRDVGPDERVHLALEHALSFFNAQKSGVLPKYDGIKFRGNSGLNDVDPNNKNAKLVGGFYDSGNNMKFSFSTAYTVTLLSWSVIEYHHKYRAMNQLDHVMDIIKWGTDYLLKVFLASDSSNNQDLLYSQVGSVENDVKCWQRPEDMNSTRKITACSTSASDLSGEIVAALSASSIVFKDNKVYSAKLIQTAKKLLDLAKKNPNQGTYSSKKECGDETSRFYNSTSYLDELAWGSTWLFLATGDYSHLKYATATFELASSNTNLDNRVYDWNNKIAANAILLTRLRYFHDPGYPYESTLKRSTEMSESVLCSYLSPPKWLGMMKTMTSGGLIFSSPVKSKAPLHFATTSAFLSKLYSDYLMNLKIYVGICGAKTFSPQMLQKFSSSQANFSARAGDPNPRIYQCLIGTWVNYILGDNPMKMSYVVGIGESYPKQVHHRGASIPWDGKYYNCEEGEKWRNSEDPNPNILAGAMVAGPSFDDRFIDQRNQSKYTEPSIAGNAGLVAALVAVLDAKSLRIGGYVEGLDPDGMFKNI